MEKGAAGVIGREGAECGGPTGSGKREGDCSFYSRRILDNYGKAA